MKKYVITLVVLATAFANTRSAQSTDKPTQLTDTDKVNRIKQLIMKTVKNHKDILLSSAITPQAVALTDPALAEQYQHILAELINLYPTNLVIEKPYRLGNGEGLSNKEREKILENNATIYQRNADIEKKYRIPIHFNESDLGTDNINEFKRALRRFRTFLTLYLIKYKANASNLYQLLSARMGDLNRDGLNF